MGKVELTKITKAPVFRKIAMGSWKTVGDPSVYGMMDIDMSKTQEFVKKYSEKHNIKISPAHIVGKAIAMCMEERPEINGMIRGSRLYLRKNVSLFFQVNVPGQGADKVNKASLSGATIPNAEKLSLADIAQALNLKAQKVRMNEDNELKQSLAITKMMPWFLMRAFLNFSSWLIYGLNINLGFLGLPKDPFGSVMITNVGSLGIDLAWAPLVPYSRVPLLLTVGSIREQVIAVDGKPEVRPIMSLGVTFDHRFMDGVHAAQMARTFRKCFEDPEKYLGDRD